MKRHQLSVHQVWRTRNQRYSSNSI